MPTSSQIEIYKTMKARELAQIFVWHIPLGSGKDTLEQNMTTGITMETHMDLQSKVIYLHDDHTKLPIQVLFLL